MFNDTKIPSNRVSGESDRKASASEGKKNRGSYLNQTNTHA